MVTKFKSTVEIRKREKKPAEPLVAPKEPTPPPKEPTPPPTPEPEIEPEPELEPEPPKPPSPTFFVIREPVQEPEPESSPSPPPPPPDTPKKEVIKWKRKAVYKAKLKNWRKAPKPLVSIDVDEDEEEGEDNTLDYLAKYCIVFKHRVPYYLRVFNNFLRKQGVPVVDEFITPKTSMVQSTGKRGSAISLQGEDTGLHSATSDGTKHIDGDDIGNAFGANEEEDYMSALDISVDQKRDLEDEEEGIDLSNLPPGLAAKIAAMQFQSTFDVEDYNKKLTFELDRIAHNTELTRENVRDVKQVKKQLMARMARQECPQIFDPNWDPRNPQNYSKNDKKSKKDSTEDAGLKQSQPQRPHLTSAQIKHLPDEWIIGRLSEEQVEMLSTDAELRRVMAEEERAEEKLAGVEEYLLDLQHEKRIIEAIEKSMKMDETHSKPSGDMEFRRLQSGLYQQMNPVQEHEVSMKDLEKLLQQVNNNLLTTKECQFIFHLLQMPQRCRLNQKLFTVVAALSEKITRLEPFLRKLINKLDFNALDVKMERAKELFWLLEEEDALGRRTGTVPIKNLALELEAGGMKKKHIEMVVDKFNREGKDTVDFLDYVTYIPLFIDIHDVICSDPFGFSDGIYGKT